MAPGCHRRGGRQERTVNSLKAKYSNQDWSFLASNRLAASRRRRVSGHPHLGGDGVGEHAFDAALAGGDAGDFDGGFAGHALIGDGFEEFADPDTAGVAGRAARRQNVICADGFVAVGDGGFLADEERAVVGQVGQVIVRIGEPGNSRCSGA